MTTATHLGTPDRATILRAMRELYKGPAWHGPSVRAALKGVTAAPAARRIAPGRNYQKLLIASVERAPAARLERVRGGQRRTVAHELLGGAMHDAYHAGQIKLLALELEAR